MRPLSVGIRDPWAVTPSGHKNPRFPVITVGNIAPFAAFLLGAVGRAAGGGGRLPLAGPDGPAIPNAIGSSDLLH